MNNDDYKVNRGAYRELSGLAEGVVSPNEIARKFMNKVYNWMSGGLILTGLIAYWAYTQMLATKSAAIAARQAGQSLPFFWNMNYILLLCLAEFGLVLLLSWGIRKLSPQAAGICFIAYSLLSGITLAPLLMYYTAASVATAFFITAGAFGATSLYGYLTKKDLTSMGSLLFMGLIGLIIASLVNMFTRSEGFAMLLNYLGVLIFVGLTAWDTQKLRVMAQEAGGDSLESAEMKKFAILGALSLYLDFINIFIFLLRIFGGRRD